MIIQATTYPSTSCFFSHAANAAVCGTGESVKSNAS